MNKYILSLDLGTTAAKCMVFDKSGRVAGKAGRALKCFYPEKGFVEQSPDDLFQAIKRCALEAILSAKAKASHIEAIGISVQRETVILWDRSTGEAVTEAYSWQCSRGASYIDALSDVEREEIRTKTGLIPNPYFSASKIKWALENIPGLKERARAGDIALGTPDSWLIWNLIGGKIHATDYTNASRTMLFNIDTLEWDARLLDIFGIPSCMLPEVHPSGCCFSETTEDIFGSQIPIWAVVGDQQSSLFGQCCFSAGDVKNTYGTGCFVLMNTGADRIYSQNGLLSTLTADSRPGEPRYALEGSVFMCGALIDWLRDGLCIIKDAAETKKAAEAVTDTSGVYMVPAFTGLGAPYWDSCSTGLITGITRATRREHIIRAALEGICYQNADVIKAMQSDSGLPVNAIFADGGASKNDFLMQYQANVINTVIKRMRYTESTALGAAFLAGLACGFWRSRDEVREIASRVDVFKPEMDEAVRERMMSGWHEAVKRVLIK